MNETWRPIPGFPDYEASDLGRIKSTRRGKPRFLLGSPNAKSGHLHVAVLDANGKQVLTYIHRLVLLAFVGPTPEGMVSRHLDGNPANNRLDNLRYGTHGENWADARAHVTQETSEAEMSLADAARVLGVGAPWVMQLARRGELAGRKIRGMWVMDAESVATYIRRPPGPRPRKQVAA